MTEYDRLPPQDLAIERAVLDACMLDARAADEAVEMLVPDDFFADFHGRLFAAIVALRATGTAPHPLLLVAEMEQQGGDRDSDMKELLTVQGSAPHAGFIGPHCAHVKSHSISRRLIEASSQNLMDAYRADLTAPQKVEQAESRIFAIGDHFSSSRLVTLKVALDESLAELAAREEGGISGTPSGFLDLDDLTGGFRGTQLIILAGRPGTGKSAMAANICENVALEQGLAVLFISLEMGRRELADRFWSSNSRVCSAKLRETRALGSIDRKQLGDSLALLQAANIHIDDSPIRTVGQIGATARRLAARQDVGLIAVDYLQLIQPEESRNDSRQEQIAKISRRLKVLAKELDRPLLVLSQLNRKSEDREDRRPRLADLRESGGIEQDADLVILMHRPELYDPNDMPGIAEVNLAKNRNGPTGTIRLAFRREITRFEAPDPLGDAEHRNGQHPERETAY